jgi:hypothetical protein
MKLDFGSLLVAAVVLLAVGQAIERLATPFAQFVRGILIGLSIACSLIGLVLYSKSSSKG